MKRFYHRGQRGFSLTELTIVMGIIGTLIGSVWSYAGSARQKQNVISTIQAASATAQSTRDAYANIAAISGGVPTVVPLLVSERAMPSVMQRAVTSACGGITSTYADTPWIPTVADTCGTFRVCAWNYGTTTACSLTTATPLSMQSFAIELTQLNYGSCLQLAQAIVPNQPPGLKDVYINGYAIVLNGGGLPIAPATAAAKCASPSVSNIVDIVYTLRAPQS